MRVSSDFYVRKQAAYRGDAYQDVTLHACGDHTVEPADEMVNGLGAPTEGFRAAGVLVLRVTNNKLRDAFRPGTVFHVVLEEKVGSVYLPQEKVPGCPA